MDINKKLRLGLIFASSVIVLGCTNFPDENKAPSLQCHFNSLSYNSGYNVYFNIVNENKTIKSGGFYVKKEGAGRYEIKNSESYISDFNIKAAGDKKGQENRVIKKAEYGFSISTSITDKKDGINFTVDDKSLSEIKTIGEVKDLSFVQAPVFLSYQINSSAKWGEESISTVDTVKRKREANPYFYFDEIIVDSPSPTTIKLIACPSL